MHCKHFGIAVAAFALFSAVSPSASFGAASERNVQYFVSPTDSMLPAIASGQLLGVDLKYYQRHPVKDDEVIVFTPPVGSEAPFVKRVLAVPGDSLRIENGRIFRNGHQLSSHASNPSYDLQLRDFRLFVDGVALTSSTSIVPPQSAWTSSERVPAGCYLVFGDNRNVSNDSHVWGFLCPGRPGLAGTKPHILGRVLTKMVPV